LFPPAQNTNDEKRIPIQNDTHTPLSRVSFVSNGIFSFFLHHLGIQEQVSESCLIFAGDGMMHLAAKAALGGDTDRFALIFLFRFTCLWFFASCSPCLQLWLERAICFFRFCFATFPQLQMRGKKWRVEKRRGDQKEEMKAKRERLALPVQDNPPHIFH
jgi:hypothetical protein